MESMNYLNTYTYICKFNKMGHKVCCLYRDNNMIIGNLSKFGIWINGSIGNLSYIKFYVNGHSIGTFDDGTYTSMFINNFIQRLDTLHNLDIKLPNNKKICL